LVMRELLRVIVFMSLFQLASELILDVRMEGK
jgi:hypothetical protein